MKSASLPTVILGVMLLFVIGYAMSQGSDIDAQAERLDKLESQAGHAAGLQDDVETLQARVKSQKKTIRQLETDVAALREGTSTVLTAEENVGGGHIVAALTSDDQAIDVIAERLVHHMEENPPINADGEVMPVTPEAVRAVVGAVQQEERNQRQERRQLRAQETVTKRVSRYKDALGLNDVQSAVLTDILSTSSQESMAIREQVREGYLDWEDARKQFRANRDTVNSTILSKLGTEKGQAVLDMRQAERDEHRGGRRGGNRGDQKDDKNKNPR